MSGTVLEVTCLLCGTEVGEVRGGRFHHHQGCERPVAFRLGQLRCCRCGGSVYCERTPALMLSPSERAALAAASHLPAAG